MIFARCCKCKRFLWFRHAKPKRMNTQYEDTDSNYCFACDACFVEIEEYWADMWREYYSGCY